MSRLVIDMTGEQHQKIKVMAAVQGVTIKDYVLNKLFNYESKEEQDWQQLIDLLETRISNAKKYGVSDRTIAEVAEDAFNKLGGV